MIAIPAMLAGCLSKYGGKVPSDPENFDPVEYPHYDVYLKVQLGASLPYASAHWDNAKLIAELSDEEIHTVTYEQLLDKGLAVGRPIP
jgi:hypothetical protein